MMYSFKYKEVRDFFFHKSFQVAPASALGYAGRLGRTEDRGEQGKAGGERIAK